MTNPHALSLRQRFSRVYYQFQPDFSFWQLVILLRKLLLCLIMASFFAGAMQMVLGMLVLTASLGLHAYILPYMSRSDYDEVLRKHGVAALTSPMHAAVRASIASIQDKGKRRLHKV